MTTIPVQRRAVLTALGAVAVTPLFAPYVKAQTGAIRIGYSVAKSGWGAGGATASTTPNYGLWAEDVNRAGGIDVDGVKRLIELTEYDDRTEVETSIRNYERLIQQDQVDFVLPPWGTGFNLAVAPLLHQAGLPHLAVACVTDQAPDFVQRWNNIFFLIGRSASAAEALGGMLEQVVAGTDLPRTVAMVSVQDQFGIELASAMRPILARYGFELVMDQSYPLGTQDLGPMITEARGLSPTVFVGCSYPPDTIALTEQARIQAFNPKVFYTAVGTAYALYRDTFGARAEGVMGSGGVDMRLPGVRDYIARHIAHAGSAPDYWAAPVTYASLQMLGVAIGRVGLDRAAVIDDLASGTFETIIGPVTLENHMRRREWWVGQWQNGDFHAVGPAGATGVVPAKLPKPTWD
jgi:branched-chain amino acid transport system substrate-binding protein